MSIIKFYVDHQFVVDDKTAIGACLRHARSLLLSKSWMLLVMSILMIIRMPEAYAINVTVKSTTMSLTSVVLPTANIVSLMKGKRPISIPENEVVTSVDAEDYLDEDSDEDYDDLLKKDNVSGECACLSHLKYPRSTVTMLIR